MLALLLVPATASAAEPTRIIVKRDAGLSAAERSDIRSDAGVRLVDTLSLPRTEVVTAPAGEASDALRELNADSDVEYAELDRPIQAFSADPDFSKLWALQNLGNFTIGGDRAVNDADMDVTLAWAWSTGRGRTVAVVDSGVDATHPDLAGHVSPGWDFVDDDPSAADAQDHGTHVAGTIAATKDNNVGVAGVAPDARILPLRVLKANGSGVVSDAIAAYDFAAAHGVRIVNASLGGSTYVQAERDVIARHPATLFVAAAGNGGADEVGDNVDVAPQYPCAYNLPNVLCVAASRHDDTPAEFSNYGPTSVDLFAPGYSIYSTVPGGGYEWMSGTSTAAPHIAGEAALLLSRNSDLTVDGLRDAILRTTEVEPGLEGKVASDGRANANFALTRTDSDDDTVPESTDNCPADPNEDQSDTDGDGVGDACITDVDIDGDGVVGASEKCPAEAAAYAGDGCPGNEPGSDGDYWPAGVDQCPALAGAVRGCPDADHDGVIEPLDNCPNRANQDQADADRDRIGNVCDSTPRGPDADGDGRPQLDDACPTVYAKTANGCPPKPAPAIPDSDGDGRRNNVDACPYERALGTLNGCPLPAVTALSAKPRKRGGKRYASIAVRTSRAATVRLVVQRKVGKRWRKVSTTTRTTSATNRVSLKTKRLKRGRYRVRVALSSAAGSAATVTKAFRVR